MLRTAKLRLTIGGQYYSVVGKTEPGIWGRLGGAELSQGFFSGNRALEAVTMWF